MLIIPDIHINQRYASRIISELSRVIDAHPHEKEIVFLWDYVYMFSYDRGALMQLLDMMYGYVLAWKCLYVMAWNHDRIGKHFVFDEAVKTLKLSRWHENLHFITTPQHFEISWKSCVFVPYVLDPDTIWPHDHHTDTKMRLSSAVHNYLSMLDPTQDITIFHHYYRADLSMPWVKAMFKVSDAAIDPIWLQTTRRQFISWHVHHIRALPQCRCLGSCRSTTPNENNLHHAAWIRNDNLTPVPLAIHDHMQLRSDHDISQDDISHCHTSITQNLYKNRKDAIQHVDFESDLAHTTIEIITSQPNIVVDIPCERVQMTRKEAINTAIPDIQEDQNSSAQRKDILIDYLKKKYPETWQKYYDLLKKLSIAGFE